jgi:hypothetical protein
MASDLIVGNLDGVRNNSCLTAGKARIDCRNIFTLLGQIWAVFPMSEVVFCWNPVNKFDTCRFFVTTSANPSFLFIYR